MSAQAGRVILGLDPGTASTGFGVISVVGNRLHALDYGVMETQAGSPLEKRLEKIFREMHELLAKHQPTATAVESLFFNANVRTALAVGQARGVTLLACAQAGCEVFEYTPQQIKQGVVGYGKATKEQVMEMVRVLLALPAPVNSDHAADALGVAICHANTCGIRDGILKSGAAGAADAARRSLR
jgi:crossover junction endodeoxyribonuclease RuvC